MPPLIPVAGYPDRDVFLWVLEQNLGKPYLWGGDDPLASFDCSGLMIEGLKSAGALPRDGDWTAEGLYQRFVGMGRAPVKLPALVEPGMLLFWARPGPAMTHVEAAWRTLPARSAGADPLVLTLGASGGGSKTLTLADAIAQNAYVKVRPAAPGWVAVWPFAPRP